MFQANAFQNDAFQITAVVIAAAIAFNAQIVWDFQLPYISMMEKR
jgi:hypothetical protein